MNTSGQIREQGPAGGGAGGVQVSYQSLEYEVNYYEKRRIRVISQLIKSMRIVALIIK